MLLNIKYFGLLAEVTSCEEESLEFNVASVSELLNILFEKYPLLRQKDFQVAQGQELVSKESKLSGGEIALLPPFSGG